MSKKLSAPDLIALLAIAGITTTGVAGASNVDNDHKRAGTFQASDRTQIAEKGGEMACGKGACGTDEKGAKAAQEKHKTAKKSEVKKVSKVEKVEKKEAKGAKESKEPKAVKENKETKETKESKK